MARAMHDSSIRILKQCDITKNYPILIDVMENHPDIDKEDLIQLSDEHKRFFDNVYSLVLSRAYDEWTGSPENDIKHYDKKEKICYICKAKIKNVCTIHNKINKKSIDIGTECNKHFGIYNEDTVNELIKRQEELCKLDALDRKYPELLKKIIKWDDIIKESEIYVFQKIKEGYLEIKTQLVKLNKEYVESDKITEQRKEYILARIGHLLEEGKIQKNKVNIFILNNKGKLFIPTKKMVSTLDRDGVKWIEEDEVIKARTLHKFKDEDFAKKLVPEFNDIILKKGLRIISTSRNNGVLGYNIKINQQFILFINYSEFCWLLGAEITNEIDLIEEYTKDDIIKECKLIDEESIDYALYGMKNKLNKYIDKYVYFNEYQDVVWKINKEQNSNGKYIKTNIDKIRALLKEEVIFNDKYSKFELFSLIKENSQKIDSQDTRDLFKQRGYDIKDID